MNECQILGASTPQDPLPPASSRGSPAPRLPGMGGWPLGAKPPLGGDRSTYRSVGWCGNEPQVHCISGCVVALSFDFAPQHPHPVRTSSHLTSPPNFPRRRLKDTRYTATLRSRARPPTFGLEHPSHRPCPLGLECPVPVVNVAVYLAS